DEIDAVLIDPRVLCGTDLQVAGVRGARDSEALAAWSQAQKLLDHPDASPGWHPVTRITAGKTARRSRIEALVAPSHHRLAAAVVSDARGSGAEIATVDLDVLGELRPAFDDIRPVTGGNIDKALTAVLVDL